MSNRSLSVRRRLAAAVGLGTLALATAVVSAPTSVSAGPYNYGSVKVAVSVDGSGTPRVIQNRSAYLFSVSPGTRPSVRRNRVGSYTIEIPAITAPGGNVQIAPWSTGTDGNPPVCTIGGWNLLSPGVVIDVACFDATTGEPREGTRFDVHYTNIPNGWGRNQFTYVWNSSAAPTATTPIDTEYYFSGRGAPAPTIDKVSRGTYRVVFNEAMGAWTPIVTAYGTAARWCNPVSVERSGAASTTVDIVCFRPGGRKADSLFSLIMANGSPISGYTLGAARVRLNRPAVTGLVTQTQFSASASTPAVPNTYRRLGVGLHKVSMPGVRGQIDAGSVQAYDAAGARCFIIGLVTSRSDTALGGYRTRCVTATGAAADVRLWAIRADMTQFWSGT